MILWVLAFRIASPFLTLVNWATWYESNFQNLHTIIVYFVNCQFGDFDRLSVRLFCQCQTAQTGLLKDGVLENGQHASGIQRIAATFRAF